MNRHKSVRTGSPQPKIQLLQTRSADDLVRDGNARRTVGDFSAAERAYREAIRLDPDCMDGWAELGCLMADSRRFEDAVHCFRRLLPDDLPGDVLDSAREAIRLLSQIVESRPGWSRGPFSLGCAYEHLEDYAPARLALAKSLELDSSREAAVQSLFARMHYLEKNWAEALSAAERALAANPNFFLAHIIRGECCAEFGDWEESAASVRRAIQIQPHHEFHSHLMFDMNYLVDTTLETFYDEACRWNSLHAAPLAKQIRPHTNSPDPDRRLKIGYVSPDLYSHPITKFVLPALEKYDRSRFEVFVYAVGSKSDNVTDWIRARVENFVAATNAGIELTERVRADGIDILVDLAGHTTGSSYLAFALKPAPIQVSWLGVLSTTGMSTIDYFLGDACLPCPGTEHLFTETVYRLPRSFCCYRPTENIPVAPAPFLHRGYVTFGSFNNPRKINREVVRLWSAILHLVPESRLLFKWFGMEGGPKQAQLTSWLAEDGIPPERLQFAGASPPNQYLQDYSDIDIALDPFPYHGGSTTLDALWMGVPVVTLAGRITVQRTGVSLLTAIGLGQLVAHSPEEYLKTALLLAAAVPKIPGSRDNLRKALLDSPLMDEVGIVRDVENAYRDMWRIWCKSKV